MEIEERAKIKSVIQQILMFNTKASLSLKNLGYLPRWVILLIDVIAICFSGVLTYYLFKGIGLNYFHSRDEEMKITIYFVVNLLFFWWFKTYSGIIRHSSFIDAIKILLSQGSTLVVLVSVNLIYSIFTKENLYITTALLINIIFSFFILFLYRVLVKQFFEVYIKGIHDGTLVRAIVYGSDANAISVSNALISEVPTRFKLIGFIDKYNLNESKRILDLPILNQKKKISVIMRSMDAEALIIADKGLSKEEQLAIVDECLE